MIFLGVVSRLDDSDDHYNDDQCWARFSSLYSITKRFNYVLSTIYKKPLAEILYSSPLTITKMENVTIENLDNSKFLC